MLHLAVISTSPEASTTIALVDVVEESMATTRGPVAGLTVSVVMVSLFDGETTLPGASLLQVWRRTAPLTKSINENVDFHNKTVKLYRGSILTTRVKCFSGASPLHWKREGFAGTDLGGDPSRALVQPGTQMVRNSPN